MESRPSPALLGPVLRSSELSPSHSPGPLAGPRSLTVEGDTGEPLEQGDASAQLLCLRAGPPQLCSIASVTEAEPSPQEAGRLGRGVGGDASGEAAPLPPLWAPPPPGTHSSSRCSMAKARTVRTLPRASSATPVALATCGESRSQGAGMETRRGDRGVQGREEDGRECWYLLLTLARQFSES